MPIWATILIALIAAALSAAAFFYFGQQHRRKTAEAKIGSAEEEAVRIVNDAVKSAEQKRKETLVEAKDEVFRLKAEADKEIKDRRS